MTAEDTALQSRIIGIVVDEAHLTHSWRSFRVQWGSIGAIRPFFPGVPIMTLSATVTPYVRRFIHRSLDMMPATRFIHRSVDRPNIYLHTRLTTGGLKSHKDLYWLVPIGIRHPADIYQTIVFSDSRDDCQKACTEFWKLSRTPSAWKRDYPWTFAEVTTALNNRRRSQVMSAFQAGLVRILFATEVAGMGIDFPNVCRVIQWQVTPKLTAASLWQRFGRTARSANTIGLAILYHSARTLISPSDKVLGILTQNPFQSRDIVPKALAAIEDFATSKALKPVEDPLDRDLEPSEPEPELYKIDHLLEPQHPDQHSSIGLGNCDSDSESDDGAGYNYGGTTTEQAAGPTRTIIEAESDSDTQGSGVSDAEGSKNHGLESNSTRKPAKMRGLPAVCRGVLWVINTTGCIRGTFLAQFDEPHLDWTRLDVNSNLLHPVACCDRHTNINDAAIPEPLRRLLPPPEAAIPPAPSVVNSEDHTTVIDDGRSVYTVGHSNTSWTKKDAIFDALYKLRETVWHHTARFGVFTPYTASALLPDNVILAIARRCDTIVSTDDIDRLLAYLQWIGKTQPVHNISSQQIFETISPVIANLDTSIQKRRLPKEHSGYNSPDRLSSTINTQITDQDRTLVNSLDTMMAEPYDANNGRSEVLRQQQREQQTRQMNQTIEANDIWRAGSKEAGRKFRIPQVASAVSDAQRPPTAPIRYMKKHIPKELFDALPKLPRGRPSKENVAERHQLIDAYWASHTLRRD